MSSGEQHTEVWTYIGLRQGKGGAFDYAWRHQSGSVYLTKKRLRQVPVGGQIEITVTADDKVVTSGEEPEATAVPTRSSGGHRAVARQP